MIVWFTYCVVLEEDWAPLILDIVEEGEEDEEQGDDEEEDDSQATVYNSTEFYTFISLFVDLFLRVLD